MATILDDHATERSTYVITVSFVNEDGIAVTPTAATWTLTDRAGTVVNSRSAVTITPLATSATIVLSGADLALPDARKRARFVTVEYAYSSALGSDLPGKVETEFYIDALRAVS
jgi:hypothetical protein